jgi:hypothetical protein
MLNSNGHFLISTPFLLKVHEFPIDCSRWTKDGLKYLLIEAGFSEDKIQVFSWGNRSCINANFNNWVKYNPMFHSLKNETNFPIVIWAIAKK